jgi:undecaprenyl-diphosphatase
MEGSTFFASPVFSAFIVGFLTLFALYNRQKKKFRPAAMLIPVLFAALVLGEIYGKTVVHHPSPPFFMIKNPTSFFPKDYVNEQFSYPSGHTARAVFISVVLMSLIARTLTIRRENTFRWLIAVSCVGLYVVIVAVSRIYLGHHWFSDIVGGALLGSGMSLFAITGL